MKIRFYKYQGTGNDFILIDNRRLGLPHHTQELFEQWCSRRFGVGADGLMFLEEEEGYDFRMVYFNSDGRPSSMCGMAGDVLFVLLTTLELLGMKPTLLRSMVRMTPKSMRA